MSISEELARLAQLRDSGVLSDEEFEAQKRAVLAGQHAPTVATAAPANKRRVGKGCLILVGILIVLGIIGAIAGGGSKTSAPDKPVDATPPLSVTATELFRAYEANEAAAQQQYGGRPLLVSATLDKVDLGIGDEPYLLLKTPNEFMSAHADLNDASKGKAAGLQRGQSIKLLCGKVGEVVGTPMLDDCDIQ